MNFGMKHYLHISIFINILKNHFLNLVFSIFMDFSPSLYFFSWLTRFEWFCFIWHLFLWVVIFIHLITWNIFACLNKNFFILLWLFYLHIFFKFLLTQILNFEVLYFFFIKSLIVIINNFILLIYILSFLECLINHLFWWYRIL